MITISTVSSMMTNINAYPLFLAPLIDLVGFYCRIKDSNWSLRGCSQVCFQRTSVVYLGYEVFIKEFIILNIDILHHHPI